MSAERSTPSVFLSDPDCTLWHGDALETLREFPAESVDCVVTSPPYWGLRDYGQEGQLGLEPTPEQYVERMVEVFREVRRVLAAHGTVWLNLGDSYSGGKTDRDDNDINRRNENGPASTRELRKLKENPKGRQRPVPAGLKPKDLVGIPWLVARALQEPYYTGRVKSASERTWLAATLDGEGTICGFRHERKDDGRVRTGAHVFVTNSSTRMLDEAERIWPASRSEHSRAGEGHLGDLPTYRWIVHGIENKIAFLREVYPHLIVKRTQAVLAYNLLLFMVDAKRAARTSQHVAILEKRDTLVRLLSEANHGGLDVPSWCVEPPELYEPGWYLRSDIIWSKPNPMPESVTDRPTKAHEYVFLLSKQPRYFFDQEALREKAEWARWGDQTVGPGSNPNGWIQPRAKESLTWNERKDAGEPLRQGLDGKRVVVKSVAERNQGRNIRSVWEIATQPYPEAHFATFPEELARRCIAAGTSERGKCLECGAPWVREVEASYDNEGRKTNGPRSLEQRHETAGFEVRKVKTTSTTGWLPSCGCIATHNDDVADPTYFRPVPTVVLDPFMGSGTVAFVARKLGRHSVGIDLNAEYLELAARRLQQQSLFAGVPGGL